MSATEKPAAARQYVKMTDVASGESWVIDTRPDPLMRDDAWRTADGTEIPLDEMSTTHIERVIFMNRMWARRLHRTAIHRMMGDLDGPFAPRGDMAQDGFDRLFGELIDAEPREWVDQTPLMRALREILVMRSDPWLADPEPPRPRPEYGRQPEPEPEPEPEPPAPPLPGTVGALREALAAYPDDMEVEILDSDGIDSRSVGEVSARSVTRGWALPNPRTYEVVVLASGMEGL